MLLRDVMVDVACWREGLNRFVGAATMQEKHTQLVQAELDQHNLSLVRIEGTIGLVCNNPLKEGRPSVRSAPCTSTIWWP